jgi:hypothetical protein
MLTLNHLLLIALVQFVALLSLFSIKARQQ